MPSIKHLLWHRATISGAPVPTIASGKTESVDTFPDKVINVPANIQAMRGRSALLGMGVEEVGTHRIWLDPDVECNHHWWIKATSGPYSGEYYRVVFIEKFDHHLEATVEIDNDAKKKDILA